MTIKQKIHTLVIASRKEEVKNKTKTCRDNKEFLKLVDYMTEVCK